MVQRSVRDLDRINRQDLLFLSLDFSFLWFISHLLVAVLVPNSNSLSEQDCKLCIRVLATLHDIDWELLLDQKSWTWEIHPVPFLSFKCQLPSVRSGIWFYLPCKPIYKSVDISWVINMSFISYGRASIVSINQLAVISLVSKSHVDCSMGPGGWPCTQ